ncbi:MAG: Trk system potassium transporter TrkA [Archaeoglobaceae archaeon]|nr:Trk system potassium transporter TrkA [Archaeoglobaceae archaeon]MDW8118449.1 Trk system potassium transporter TrkA [Archaeoglobaceae archaeon]
MQIVIAGAGEVGYELAKSLSGKNDVYVIEKDKEKVDRLNELDVIAIKGNAANMNILKEAKIERADIFLGVTGNDEVNILSGISAKKLGAKRVFVRVENLEYADKPVTRYHPLGFDVVVCPPLVLAQEIVELVGIPFAEEVITLSSGEMDIVELQISENSPVIGKGFMDLNLSPEVVLVSIHRNGDVILPGEENLREGDRVVIVGKREEVEKLRDLFGQPVAKRVTVFGTNEISSYVAETLYKSRISVKVVGASKKACEDLSEKLRGIRVVCGDFLDLEFLNREEVGKSNAVVALTDSDERNLMLSLLSKSLGAERAIVKVEHEEYAKIFEKVGIEHALNPKRMMILEVQKILLMDKVEVRTIADLSGAVVMELVVNNEKIRNKRIVEVPLPKNSAIWVVIRNEKCLAPHPDLRLELGDRVVVRTTWDKVKKIGEIFG